MGTEGTGTSVPIFGFLDVFVADRYRRCLTPLSDPSVDPSVPSGFDNDIV